jgi:hypothetical protein
MKTFLGMELEQKGQVIKLDRDYYHPASTEGIQGIHHQEDASPQEGANIAWCVLKAGRYYGSSGSAQAEVLLVICGQASICRTWVRMDVSFTVSQLARFCASAGNAQRSALQHLMEYLEGNPSFKITYQRSYWQIEFVVWLSRFGLGQELFSTMDVWHAHAVQQVAHVMGGSLPWTPPGRLRIRPGEAYTHLRGQLGVHRVGQQRHRRTRVDQAHGHLEALRSRGDSERSNATATRQGPDLGPAGGHPDQGTTPSAVLHVHGEHLGMQEDLNSLGDLCPQEGGGCQGYHVESPRPFRGECRRLGESRPELDIHLNPSRPGPGSRWPDASQLVDGSGQVRICR